MILAIILTLAVSGKGATLSAQTSQLAQPTVQSDSTTPSAMPPAQPEQKPDPNKDQNNSQNAVQDQTTSAKPKSSSSSKTHPMHQTTAGTKPRPRKKVTPVDCTPAASGAAENATTPTSNGASGTASSAQKSPTANSSSNCPPKKTIVREGGATDQPIQLAGPPVGGQQANQQKDSTNQMLGATEQNLKKVEGRQLSENQQNMVSQARQFMDQSRKAINAGDLDRARTLAWKAQLLSEDLIKPEN